MTHQGTDWEACAQAGLRALVNGYAGLPPERPLQVKYKVLLLLLVAWFAMHTLGSA